MMLGCTRKTKITEPALARVGSSVLTVKEARANIPSHIIKKDSIKAFQTYRDEWIDQQLLIQEAYRLRINKEPEVRMRLNKITDDYLAKAAQNFIISDLNKDLSISDAEARAYYQENKDSFVLEERYIRFRHLATHTLNDAENARNDLMRGVPWETVARDYSVNPEFTLRESQRYWPESMAVSDMEILNRYLMLIGVTEISVIEKIGDTYHFVQLMDERAKGEHPELDWLVEQIKDWLLMEKRRRTFNTYLKNLYLEAHANNEIETFQVGTTN